MYYNARWYDPALGRFAQADSIVPPGVQGLDRYAYVNNNPMRYTDPTGHMCREDGKGCESGGKKESAGYTAQWLRLTIKNNYFWKVDSGFSEDELNAIYQTGKDIEAFVNKLVNGSGREWMIHALGNTNIVRGGWNDPHGEAWPRIFGTTIKLGNTWLSNSAWDSNQLLAHEFGHVWDMNTGNILGIGGGPADELNYAMGGKAYLSPCRWCTGKPDPNNPPGLWTVNGGYGNESVNDYFAEAFSWSVYGGAMPTGVEDWISEQIIFEASFLQ